MHIRTLDGRHRLTAAHELGLKTIPALIPSNIYDVLIGNFSEELIVKSTQQDKLDEKELVTKDDEKVVPLLGKKIQTSKKEADVTDEVSEPSPKKHKT